MRKPNKTRLSLQNFYQLCVYVASMYVQMHIYGKNYIRIYVHFTSDNYTYNDTINHILYICDCLSENPP